MSDARSTRTTTRRQSSFTSEVAAFALTPAAAIGFIRIFEVRADAGSVVAAAAASSLLTILLRRLRIPLAIAGLVSLATFYIVAMNALAPGTTRLIVIPTEETRTVLNGVATTALEMFRTQRAPVEALSGFVAAACAGAWVSAFIVDWAAMRLRLAFEPVLPAGLLFLFTAVTGSGEYQILSTAVFGAAIVGWSFAHRLAEERQVLWLTADRRRGPARLATGAAAFGTVAVVAGLIAGPLLPGAGQDELFDWRNGGDPTRTVVSPFVDIGDRLVEQRDVDLFQVRSQRPSYYRLAGLDTFEDNGWVSRDQSAVEESGGRLPGQRPTSGTTQMVGQQFEIQSLSGAWAPAAYAPANITSSGAQFSWIAETSSLITDGSVESIAGLSYALESVIPIYTAEELRAATTNPPEEIRQRYLAIPDDVTPVLAQVARELTADAPTDYDRLIALQDYFRDFDYSLDLGAANGDPIEQFLNERRGFCQQFSGTFALMARALNIPSRVAVGFTWGDPVPGDPGLYQITGRHTHAWPEVYFADLGWVAFEPTPTRGSPAGTGYTTVPAEQDSATQPDNPFAPTTTAPDLGSGLATPTTRPPEDDQAVAGVDGVTGLSDDRVRLPWRWIGLVAVVGALAAGGPLVQRMRRDRRRQRATTPAEEINSAWADVTEAIERQYQILRTPSETRASFCARVAVRYPFRSLPIEELGIAATTARYAPERITQETASSAKTHADQILAELRDQQTPLRRWWQEADPRRLFRPTVRLRIR